MEMLKWTSSSGGRLHAPKYPGDAGFDLEVVGEHVVKPHEITQISCGISVEIPDSYAALLVGRSSSYQYGLMVMTTLIDSGYRGPLFLLVYNVADTDRFVNGGTRLAQLLLLPNFGRLADNRLRVQPQQVESLSISPRGANGFGSTGGSIA